MRVASIFSESVPYFTLYLVTPIADFSGEDSFGGKSAISTHLTGCILLSVSVFVSVSVCPCPGNKPPSHVHGVYVLHKNLLTHGMTNWHTLFTVSSMLAGNWCPVSRRYDIVHIIHCLMSVSCVWTECKVVGVSIYYV